MHKLMKMLLAAAILAPLTLAAEAEQKQEQYPVVAGSTQHPTITINIPKKAYNPREMILVINKKAHPGLDLSPVWRVFDRDSAANINKVIINDGNSSLSVKAYAALAKQLTDVQYVELNSHSSDLASSKDLLKFFATSNGSKKLDFYRVILSGASKNIEYGTTGKHHKGLLSFPEIDNSSYYIIKELIELTNQQAINFLTLHFGQPKKPEYLAIISESLSNSFVIWNNLSALLLNTGPNVFGKAMYPLDGATFPNVKHLDVRGASVNIHELATYVCRFICLESLVMEFDDIKVDTTALVEAMHKILVMHKSIKWVGTNLDLAAGAGDTPEWLALCEVISESSIEMLAFARANNS